MLVGDVLDGVRSLAVLARLRSPSLTQEDVAPWMQNWIFGPKTECRCATSSFVHSNSPLR